MAIHAEPRFTEDLDVFVEPTLHNARKLHAALVDFGFEAVAPLPAQLAEPDKVWMLGRKPRRIDILTGISGVSFKAASQHSNGRRRGVWIGQESFFSELVENIEAREAAENSAAELERLRRCAAQGGVVAFETNEGAVQAILHLRASWSSTSTSPI